MKMQIKELLDKFLNWPLPASVRSDLCVTMVDYPHQRIGTNLLTATEAEEMLKHVVGNYLKKLEAVAAAAEARCAACLPDTRDFEDERLRKALARLHEIEP
jgi:hypothetical protein